MTNEQKIRNLAVKFFKQFKDELMPRVLFSNEKTVWQEIRNSYGYGEEPKTHAEYIKRLKYNDFIEAGWLLSEIAIPSNDKFKFLIIETIEGVRYDTPLVKIGKQYFEIEVEKFTEYKPKKKIIYVLEKCDD
jgi:hypothetical protein